MIDPHYWPSIYPGIFIGLAMGWSMGGLDRILMGGIGGLVGAIFAVALVTQLGVTSDIVNFVILIAFSFLFAWLLCSALPAWLARRRTGR